MVKVIIIKDLKDIEFAVRTLGRMRKNIPLMTRGAMKKWGKMLVKDTKSAVVNANIKSFTGTLQGKGIRWEQKKNSDQGFLFIRAYGIRLDSMTPQTIRVYRSRTKLLRWSRQAKNPIIRKKAKMVESGKAVRFDLRVRPHPFIASGYRRARPKLRPILNRSIKQAIAVS